MATEKPPYPYQKVGHCCGCRAPEEKVLMRTGPPDEYRYRCAPCIVGESVAEGMRL